jgi:hypothetical protein
MADRTVAGARRQAARGQDQGIARVLASDAGRGASYEQPLGDPPVVRERDPVSVARRHVDRFSRWRIPAQGFLTLPEALQLRQGWPPASASIPMASVRSSPSPSSPSISGCSKGSIGSPRARLTGSYGGKPWREFPRNAFEEATRQCCLTRSNTTGYPTPEPHSNETRSSPPVAQFVQRTPNLTTLSANAVSSACAAVKAPNYFCAAAGGRG